MRAWPENEFDPGFKVNVLIVPALVEVMSKTAPLLSVRLAHAAPELSPALVVCAGLNVAVDATEIAVFASEPVRLMMPALMVVAPV